MSVFYGHAGDLLTVLYGVQDVQIAAVCLYGAYGAFEGSLLHVGSTAAAMTWMWVPELSGMHPSQDTLNKVSASILVLPTL